MSKHTRCSLLVIVFIALCGISSAAQAQSISIDWFGGGGGGGTTQAQMLPTETAGVIPRSNWNSLASDANGDGLIPLSLVDHTGAATGATVTWASQNTWNTAHVQADGDLRMMKGYIDTNDTSVTNVTVAGLPAATEPWAVIVYYDGDNGTQNRVGRFTLSGATTGNATFWGRDAGGAFTGLYTPAQSPVDPLAGGGAIDNNNTAALTVPAGNFMLFADVTGTGFILEAQASVSAGGTNRAAINGIQIIPMSQVPEPGALAVIGLLGAGLLARRRNR